MDVILDSNIYIARLRTEGKELFSTTPFAELFTYLRQTKSKLVVPEPVLEEVLKEYSDLLASAITKSKKSWEVLRRTSMGTLLDRPLPNPTKDLEEFEKLLFNPAPFSEIALLESYKEISLTEIVRRGVHRIRPANDNGEELHDVVIWLQALQHAKSYKAEHPDHPEVAFITEDEHFKGAEGLLHDHLQQDCKHHDVDVRYFESILDFIRRNALQILIVSGDEIGSLVDADKLMQLLKAAFERVDYQEVSVADLQFDGAQKYKVAEESFYVEAKYRTLVRYSEIVDLNRFLSAFSNFPDTPINALQGSNPLFGAGYYSAAEAGLSGLPAFSGIGQALPLKYLASNRVKRNWESDVHLVASARINSGKIEPPEILDVNTTYKMLSQEAVTSPDPARTS
jgi:hypothetical protein